MRIHFASLAVLALAAMLVAGCGGHKESKQEARQAQQQRPPVSSELTARLKECAQRPRPSGRFGFYVYDLTADKPVYGVGQDEYMASASCLKLFTVAAAIHRLGPYYKYHTSIFTRGRMVGDTLRGDIGFRARMDPQLQPADLGMFARALRKAGIRHLDGRLVVDLAMRDPVKSEQHWYPWDLSFSRYGVLYKGADRVTQALLSSLRSHGISVDKSQVAYGRVSRDYRCLLRFNRPVELVIRRMLKNSSNTQATSLLYTLGYADSPYGGYAAAGLAELRRFISTQLGIKDKRLVVHDGCGLCTYNHLSPRSLVRCLTYIHADSAAYAMVSRNLSRAGEDGTMRREFTSPLVRGRVRGKTGTLSHPYGISSLAGYADGSDGHLLAFAIMDNDMSVLDARVLQRKLIEALVK